MKTLIIIKPDGVKRGLVGEILSRFERRGIKFLALKLIKVTRSQASQLYAVHKEKPFYSDLIDYITSGPVVVGVIKIPLSEVDNKESAIQLVRAIVGATNPAEAPPGTIRGDFGLNIRKNIIHASDSPQAAEKEISIFFKPEEMVG